MAAAPPALQGVGLPDALWRLVEPRLAAAVAGLDLTGRFGTVRIAADDLPGDDVAWYRWLPAAAGESGPVLVISCHLESFCRPQPLRTTVLPGAAIWDQFAAPLAMPLPDCESYSAARTDIFLHHHLATIDDLLAGRLQGRDVPQPLLEAFAAAWAVAIDGRLARRGLPGYGMTERRGRFSRLFSAGGIMLPEHWQIFEALWDGALSDQAAVLGAVRHLPRL